MEHDGLTFWHVELFVDAFDRWVDVEQPPADLQATVLEWIATRADDPYEGARYLRDQPFLYEAQVRGTVRDGRVVYSAFWIFEETRTVRCATMSTLSLPI